MANTFSKEEQVAFEDVLQDFEDGLVLSRNVNVYKTDAQSMERQNHVEWRPMPYIAQSFDGVAGTDQSANFTDITQLSVPATIGFDKNVAWKMNAYELNESLRNGQFGEAAKQKLASDINVAVMNLAANEGTLIVTKATAAADFGDVGKIEVMMNEQGIPMGDRFLAMSSGDYLNITKDLADRANLNPGKTLTAYEKSFVGEVSGFNTFKLDYANNVTIDAMTTIVVNGANQRHVPISAETVTVGQINHDNRYQTLAITCTTGTVKVGDCFTIAGVNAVHHITKVDTGNLKTFRIIEILTGGGSTGNIKISPAIIAADSTPTAAESMYKNVTAAPADTAVITPLNIATKKANPFWHKSAFELLPGKISINESGVSVLRGTTDQGIELTLQKQWSITFNPVL